METTSDLLMQAIFENDLLLVKYCLQKRVSVNKICKNGMTHLGAAAKTGNLQILQILLNYCRGLMLDLDVENENITKPHFLQLDVTENRRKNVGYFVVCKEFDDSDFGEGPTPDGMEALEWDMEVSVPEDDSVTPEANLYKWYAKILNESSIILKSPDNDIARLDNHGQSVLHYAVRSGNEEMVAYLIENFSELNINQCTSDWFTPLHIAVMNHSVHIIQYLLSKKNINVNSVSRKKHTPLHLAAENGDCEIINILIENGANVNAFDFNEHSPLTVAVNHCQEDAAKILIKRGASRLNHEESFGFTVLERAIWNNLTSTSKLLLEAGAKIIQSHHLLHVAVRNGNFEMVKLLVRHGALLNVREESGGTPLMTACSITNLQIARFLLEHGASTNTVNFINGLTALHFCVRDISDPRILEQFLELLIFYNVNINAVSQQGTVLFFAIILKKMYAVHLLIKHGADVNLREERAYYDNLSIVRRYGDLDTVRLIVYAGFKFKNVFDVRLLQNLSDPVDNFLATVITSPLNLRELCRIKIRSCLGNNLVRKVGILPLPTLMQRYVTLDIL